MTVPLSVAEWQRQREVYLQRDLRKVFDLGFATFYLNRTTRSGIIHNGGPIGGLDQTGNYKIDARFSREGLAARINRIAAYADRIEVTGEDGLAYLRSLDADSDRARRAFVYLDPPYYAKGSELYLNHFAHAEHAALAKYLGRRHDFRWLMTYDDVPEIRALYSSFSTVSFALSYSAYERRSGRELLIHPATLAVSSEAISQLPAHAA